MKSSLCMLAMLVACGSSTPAGNPSADATVSPDGPALAIDAHVGGGIDAHPASVDARGIDANTGPAPRTVFVIPMENEPSSQIYGNTTYAPYINGLLANAASTSMFDDELPNLVSEPHYIFMEAGTNVFSDVTFSTDAAPSASHSTSSTAHLVTQLETANVPWMSYQMGITSGKCPVAANAAGEYAPKHDPFVFFQDVSGSTPSANNAHCGAHHKSYNDFATDLAAGITGYVFITADLCHDMHGDTSCPQGTAINGNIHAGDLWLMSELPRIIAYTQTHDALIFLTWDEGDASNLIPFIAIGSHVKAGVSSTTYTHGSMLKSVEEYLGVPVLPSVVHTNDFSDLFEAGTFP